MTRATQSRNGRGRRVFVVETLETRQLLATSVISGAVYSDANMNGLFDTGETPLAGSNIVLIDNQNQVVGRTTTGANGAYSFTVTQPTGSVAATLTRTLFIPGQFTPFSTSGTIPQFDPSQGTLTSVDILNEVTLQDHMRLESRDSAPSTLRSSTTATVAASGPGFTNLSATAADSATFRATAYDHVLDFGGTSGVDFGVRTATNTNGVTLTSPAALAAYTGTGNVTFSAAATGTALVTGSGNIIQATTTAAQANFTVVYHYTAAVNPPPITYRIVQITEPPGNYTDGLESQNSVVIPNTIGTDFIQVTANAPLLAGNNFGEIPFNGPPPPVIQPSSLSGFVYFDANNNGIKEANEYGIANVILTLTGTDKTGLPVKQTTVTGYDGAYLFSNLAPGTYQITETHPGYFIDGKDTIGSQGGQSGKDVLYAIILPAPGGVNGVDNNFGELARPGCKLLGLTQFHTQPAHQLNPSRIGPLLRYALPSLVPAITRPALARAAAHARVRHHA